MMTQVEWLTKDGLFSLSCLAGNTPAVAVILRLICSPGLTLFSLCLLVVHEHFDITFEVREAATDIKLRHPKKLLILFYISFLYAIKGVLFPISVKMWEKLVVCFGENIKVQNVANMVLAWVVV